MLDKKKSHGIRIYILLVAVVLAWGLSWPVNKLGLDYLPPFWFATSRLIIGTTSMFLMLTVLKKMIFPSLNDLPLILLMGVFQIGLFILFINLSLVTASSGTAAILVYTTPLWVMPMAIFFFKEPNAWLKWVGFTLGIVGILLMLNPWEIDWSNRQVILAIIYMLSASLSLSVGILCARYMKWHHSPLELIPWQLLVGSIILIIIAFILDPYPTLRWNTTSILCLSYTGIVATAFGFLGMSKISKELPATLTSISLLGVPVSGVIFSVMMLHEPVDLFKILAIIFIVAGLSCVVLGEKKAS